MFPSDIRQSVVSLVPGTPGSNGTPGIHGLVADPGAAQVAAPVLDPANADTRFDALARRDATAAAQQPLAVFTPRPRTPPDALQRHIDRMLGAAWMQQDIAHVTALFGPCGTALRADAAALSMVSLYEGMTGYAQFPRETEIAFMPRLIETLIDQGSIDPRHAAVAREAAQRIAGYAALRSPETQVGPDAGTPSVRRLAFVRPTLRAAVDPESFERLLADPARWDELISVPRLLGRLPDSSFQTIERELLALGQAMLAQHFLPPALCARLVDQAPRIVQGYEDRQAGIQGEPDLPSIRYWVGVQPRQEDGQDQTTTGSGSSRMPKRS